MQKPVSRPEYNANVILFMVVSSFIPHLIHLRKPILMQQNNSSTLLKGFGTCNEPGIFGTVYRQEQLDLSIAWIHELIRGEKKPHSNLGSEWSI